VSILSQLVKGADGEAAGRRSLRPYVSRRRLRDHDPGIGEAYESKASA
jgi:hypothetical protein